VARNAVLQRRPIQILHHDEGATFLLTNVVNRADVWVVQGRSSLRFALKTRQSLRILRDFVRKKLEGHKTE
jgi:hypothetical protein